MKQNWTTAVAGVEHVVAIEMNDYSGRFALTVDGARTLSGRFSFADQWRMYLRGGAVLLFPVADAQAEMRVSSALMTWKAELLVDETRRPQTPLVLVPAMLLPPWWAWLSFAIALGATLVALYAAYALGVRRMPVAGLGAAGAFVCLRFSMNEQWPRALRVALCVLAAIATVALARLSLPV